MSGLVSSSFIVAMADYCQISEIIKDLKCVTLVTTLKIAMAAIYAKETNQLILNSCKHVMTYSRHGEKGQQQHKALLNKMLNG